MKQSLAYALNWDLNSIFAEGSHFPVLEASLQRTKHQLLELQQNFKQLSDPKQAILWLQELAEHRQEIKSFVICLTHQDVNDERASFLQSQVAQLWATYESVSLHLDHLLALLDEVTFRHLLDNHDIQPIAFSLKERREQIKERMSVEQEQLAEQLAVNGYQGWVRMYQTLVGQMHLASPFPEEPSLSVGQAENQLFHPDRHRRQAWFQSWEEGWGQQEQMAAQILNNLGGFRLSLYAARHWHSILHEPLRCNRMQEKTLQAMWQAVEKHQKMLYPYLEHKARLLQVERLAWCDVAAPLPLPSPLTFSFNEAASLIIDSFTRFSPAMGAFAKQAFEQRWIEAEDRPNKLPGGFCTSFPRSRQSRIFMTYSGTLNSLTTLAHELGHAYHSHELKEMPYFAQEYRMNVAETASTLAETIVINALIEQAPDKTTRLALLDDKLQRTVVFLMNIRARFLFELKFYEARRKGFVSATELNHLMLESQQQAFGHQLSEWHPHFWAAKAHFYMTDVPFYNFPYTFGYLFGQGLYAHLQRHLKRAETYAAFLRQTGQLTTEELAEQHLGVNLQELSFWEQSLEAINADVIAYTTS